MRLIDADSLENMGYELQRTYQKNASTMVYEVKKIGEIPTIVAELVRRGRWIWDNEGYHCSECFFHTYGATLECMDGTYKYCPNCGAKMENNDE